MTTTEQKKTNVLRVMKWQWRMKAEGRCITCGDEAVDGWHCEKHQLANRIRARNAYRKRHGIPLNAMKYSTYIRHGH